MTVTIVKKPSLITDILIYIIQDHFPNFFLKIYDPHFLEMLIKNENITDIILIDVDIDKDITFLIQHYKNLNRKVMIWTGSIYNYKLIDFFRLNLDAYLYHKMEEEELINAIKMVLKDEKYVHPQLAFILLNDYYQFVNIQFKKPAKLLTTREWEILELLTQGYKNDEIAQKLSLSVKTVKNHVNSILKKLGVKDRTNAVIKAFRHRWFY